MKGTAALLLLLVAPTLGAAEPPAVPLASGHYVFEHRFAEHPSMPSIRLDANVRGTQITLTNPQASDVFPVGVIAEGQLMWHAASGQWIIGQAESDKWAAEVGGCSDGPEVVDLARRIYWTC